MGPSVAKRKVQKGAKTMGQINANFPLGKSSGIAVYENVFSDDFLSSLINAFSEDFQTLFYPGPTIGGVDPFIKLSHDSDFMSPDVYSPQLRNYGLYMSAQAKIQHQIWSCIVDYIQEHRHLWPAPNVDLTGPRIQRYYRNAGYYREHCDGQPWYPPTAKHPMRILAVVAYLNTVEDGGGTIFPLHDYVSEPVAGRLVIFPTTWQYPHLGAVPLSGDKWIISAFVTVRWSDTEMYPFEINRPSHADEGFVEATELREETPKTAQQ